MIFLCHLIHNRNYFMFYNSNRDNMKTLFLMGNWAFDTTSWDTILASNKTYDLFEIKKNLYSAYSIGGVEDVLLHRFYGIKETPIPLKEYAKKVDNLWHLCIVYCTSEKGELEVSNTSMMDEGQ